MSVQFLRTARSLEIDSPSRSPLALVVGFMLLVAWGLWFFLAHITVYRVSDQVRLETMSRVHPADAAIAGQIL